MKSVGRYMKSSPLNARSRNFMIDATSVGRQKAGVGVYAKNLLDEMAKNNHDDRLFLLVQSDDPDLHYESSPSLTAIKVPSFLFRNRPVRLILEQLYIPFLLWWLKIDVLHSLHYSFPIVSLGTKRVVTIHDMTSFVMPEVHLLTKRLYFRIFITLAARFADKLIFVSRSTESDFSKRFETKYKNHVIHLGRSNRFCPNLDRDKIAEIREKYSLPDEYVLYVGTIEPRKNLIRLFEAFSLVVKTHPHVQLVVAGMKGWMFGEIFSAVQLLTLEDRITFTSFLPEEDKPFLLAGATAFAYPSLYEGFGIPVLEALATGIPTVTSNSSSLSEISGEAALLVDPRNTADIADALMRLLSDSALRLKMRDRSIRQAQRFSWEATATETLDVYREACLEDETSTPTSLAKVRAKPQQADYMNQGGPENGGAS